MNYTDDFIALLLEDGRSENTGSFNHANWQVSLSGDTTSSVSRLVTLHESLHSDLNDSTAFGTILHVYAYIVRNLDEQHYVNILNRLVYGCRTTHECFATYLSVLILTNTTESELSSLEIIKDYPDYLPYYQTAEFLCEGFKGGYLKYHAVSVSLRICMQGDAIKKLLDIGIEKFKISNFRHMDFPDTILNAVKAIVVDDYWEKVLLDAYTESPDLDGWDIVFASENDKSLYTKATSSEYDYISKYLMHYFYNRLLQDLSQKGIVVLAFDEHLNYIDEMLNIANEMLPNSSKSIRPLYANNNRYSDESLVVHNFQYERFYVASDPIEAKIYNIKEVPKDDWKHLSSGDKEHEHFFIVSRYMNYLQEQYLIKNIDTGMEVDSHMPQIFLRRSAIDENTNQRMVELFLIEKMNTLNELHEKFPNIPIVSNISMATLADDDWFSLWYNDIWSYSEVSILFDLSPFLHFDVWQEKDEFDIHYFTITIEVDQKKYYVFVCMPQTSLKNIYLIPCSSVVGSSFVYYIRELMKNNSRFIESKDFLIENQWIINVSLGHLFREEYFFDFYLYTDNKKEKTK